MFFSMPNRHNFRIVSAALLICLLTTSQSFAQIIAQPPSAERVPAGQTVSTGHESARAEMNFTDLAHYFATHPQPLVRKMLENEDDNARPSVEKPNEPWLVHLRALPDATHSSELHHLAYLPISPAPIDSFKAGGDDGTSIPPDTHGAVNGTYCMTAINDSVTIRTRAGVEVSGMTLDQFWNPVLAGGGSFDPRIFYDNYTKRWYMIADANGDLASSALLVAVSKTSSPTGGWFEFIVPVGIPGYWVDYPTVGYNKKWIAVGGNPFSVSSGASNGAVMYVFNKALLLAGTSATYTKINETNSFTICPAEMYDTVDQNLFAVESWDNTTGKLQLWKISGPVATPTMAVVGQPSSAPFLWNYQASVGGGGGDFAPQLGTTGLIQCNDDRIYDLKYINGNLWCSHNVFLPATGTTTHCSVQWWQFDTLANPVQIGYVNDNSATNPNFYYFPAVAVNTLGDVLVGFTTSSKLAHANAAYALHMHTDPVDSTRPAYVFRHGQSTYFKNYGGPRDRWGDYSQSCLDTNFNDFWTVQETVASTNTYDTWWAYVQVCQKPPASITAVGSTTVCAGSTVSLNATPTTGVTYQWLSGGTIIAGATNSSYAATTTGTYNVIVYNSTTCDSTSLPVVVSVNPLPSAISGTMSLCTGGTTNLTDATGGGTWSTASTSATVGSSTGVVTGVSTGTALISYTSATGCSVSTTVTVNAGPTSIITPAGATTFCTGGSVVLNANTGGGLTYQWQVGGGNISGATLSAYTATTGGNYTVIVYQSGCSTASTITTVTVVTTPVVTSIGGATNNVCNGQTIVLTDATSGGVWSSANTVIASVSSAGVVTGASLGTTTISYTITNLCGSISATTLVTVNVPTVVLPVTGATDICVGGTTPLTDASASGVWSSSNTAVGSVSGTGVVTGLSAGTTVVSYSVTNASGCASSSVTTVTVSAPFTAVITPLSTTTFCSGGFVTLDATTGTGFTYQWMLGGVNIAGATNANYTATTGGNYTVLVADPGGCTSTSAGVLVTVLGGTTTIPSVVITPSLGDSICSSTAETFSATPTNGGTTPTYQWYVNGVAAGTGAVYGYTPVNGDIVKVVMVSNAPCAFPDSAVNSVMMTVVGSLTPSVSISSIHNDTTCTGDTVQFDAVPVFGGTAPTYLWTENGVNVATGPSYTYTPADGDTLVVTMTSNFPCLATPYAVSNFFIIHVLAPTTNTLSVSVSQSTVASGSVDTFTAVATGAGASPSYQWYINGNPVVGATSYRYITDSLQEGQIVNCLETSSFMCSSPESVFSGGISVTVVPSGIKQIAPTGPAKFNISPNPNKGDFTINGTTGSTNDDKVTIVISDVLGQTIYSNVAVANKGNLNEHVSLGSALASGNYLVTITTGNNPVVLHVTVDR